MDEISEMKQLSELPGIYESNELKISQLVDFTSQAPLQLPADQKYLFSQTGEELHIFGSENGIKQYAIEPANEVGFARLQTIDVGIKLFVNFFEGIKSIILHSEPRNCESSFGSKISFESRSSGESRESRKASGRESRRSSWGESNSGESRSRSSSSGESRSGGESRSSGYSSYGGGESRGGESRW